MPISETEIELGRMADDGGPVPDVMPPEPDYSAPWITPAMILDAYESTHLTPTRCQYLERVLRCGCPLVALYYKRFGNMPPRSSDTGAELRQALGLTPDYFNGFIGAVDRGDEANPAFVSDMPGYARGWTDGRAVYLAVFATRPK